MDSLKDLKILYKVISFGKTEKDTTFQLLLAPLKGKHLLSSAVGISVPMYVCSTGCNSPGIALKVVYFTYTLHFRLGKIQ